MTVFLSSEKLNFFLSVPSECPYLSDRDEQKLFTRIDENTQGAFWNTSLTEKGFRRSQDILYRPICRSCQACVSIRVLVDNFNFSKSWRRIIKANEDITSFSCEPAPLREHYALFRDYISARHMGGSMQDMGWKEYSEMIINTPVKSLMREYRLAGTHGESHASQELVACSLTDVLFNGLSMVYSFFDPAHKRRSLGNYMILEHILWAKALKLPYLYLGYWVEGSKTMTYKQRFRPQERFIDDKWSLVL